MEDKSDKMFAIPALRQRWILDKIEESGAVKIKDLSDCCNVSEATIRRDLDELDARGFIERTHGGAVINRSTSFEQPDSEKMKIALAQKRSIAREAANLVKEGDSVFLDSGTTNLFIAQNLESHRNLTVITHSTSIAYMAKLHPSSSLVITGGTRRDPYGVMVGSMTENFIKELRVDKAFLGADAVHSKLGVYNSNLVEMGIKRLIASCGKKTILVTDASKFQRTALIKICDINQLDMIITDNGLPFENRRDIEEAGTELIIV